MAFGAGWAGPEEMRKSEGSQGGVLCVHGYSVGCLHFFGGKLWTLGNLISNGVFVKASKPFLSAFLKQGPQKGSQARQHRQREQSANPIFAPGLQSTCVVGALFSPSLWLVGQLAESAEI